MPGKKSPSPLASRSRPQALHNQPSVLILVELDFQRGQASRMDAPIAAKVFAGLAELLRETDMIGWYREDGSIPANLGYIPPLPHITKEHARVPQHGQDFVLFALI